MNTIPALLAVMAVVLLARRPSDAVAESTPDEDEAWGIWLIAGVVALLVR